MNRSWYSASIESFLMTSSDAILGELTRASEFSVDQTQATAWIAQIAILKSILTPYKGSVYFEYAIPRMGKRIDVLLIINSILLIRSPDPYQCSLIGSHH